MFTPLKKSQPRKFESTTHTNVMVDAFNSLGQLFNTGSGQDQRMGILVVRVKITGNASGGGKYNGRVLNKPLSGVAATGDLAAADLGDDPGVDNALVLNAQEVGQATHDLTSGTPKVTIFLGMFYGFSTDGKFLVMICNSDWEQCT